MYNGNDIYENIAARKLNILKGFSEVDNALEKAKNRQVGEIHPNGKWVWTQLQNGKYDWRTKKTSSDNGGDSKNSSDKEIVNLKSLNENKDNLEKILNNYKLKETSNGFYFHNNSKNSSISIEIVTLGDGDKSFLVTCNTNKLISSISLADPKKSYLTTSASIAKHKRYKDQKHVYNIKDVNSLINRHLNKINK